MTALDTLANRTARQGWRECSIAYALRTLDDPDADTLRRVLDNDAVAHSEIALVLRQDFGVVMAAQTVGRHRLGQCRCEAGA